MVPIQQTLEPTRVVGIAAYATAVMCCAAAWARAKASRQDARLAAVLVLLEGALLMDMVFNWRWRLHQTLMDLALQRHTYDQRRGPQELVLAVFGCLLLIGCVLAFRRFRRSARLIAVLGMIGSVVLWCTEVVSLHAVDHVLYAPLLGVKAVSFLWIVSCTVTSIGILRDGSASHQEG